MPNRTNGTLEETFVNSAVKPPGRRVWKLNPETGQPSWAAIFLDGEFYLERVMAARVLKQLETAERTPPILAVFVSSDNAGARHSDYTCDADYATFLSQDVVPWLLNSDAELDGDRILIAGLSLSGLAAAHAALTHQSQFRAAICQSPSFWWNGERIFTSLPQATDAGPGFWVSVGDQETDIGVSHPPSGKLQLTSQIDACHGGSEALRAAGYKVKYRVFPGGHDPECWREDLRIALPWVANSA